MTKHKISQRKKTNTPSGRAVTAKTRIHSDQKIKSKQRLQKVLAEAGVDSRRKCEELILDGIVRVNGKVVDSLPAFVHTDVDKITVNGREIKPAGKVYYLLNKPKGVICTNADPYGRKKAIDLIDDCSCRIFCVGRLDADSIGAIILTNDSELTNRLTHPRYELPKKYKVRIKGKIQGEDIEKLKKGTWLAEGKTGRAAVKIIRRSHVESIVEVTISQGLNRQIRRMLAKIGYKIKGLERTHIGNIGLKGLKPGNSRKLTQGQVNYLKKETGL